MTNSTVICMSVSPGLDRQLRLGVLSVGEVNRAFKAVPLPGGKSAHVAMALNALGANPVWVGFLGGAIGEEVAAGLRTLGIETVGVKTQVPTRVNLEIIEDSGRITEILEPGAPPSAAEQLEMLHTLEEGLRSRWKGALVAFSGSLPAGTDPSFYVSLIKSANNAGSLVFLDTSGESLQAGIGAHPDFVKPNRKEAEPFLESRLESLEEIAKGTMQLIERGARSAAITLGADGIVWRETSGEVWLAKPPGLRALTTVGCGDTMFAGFAFAALQGWTGERALRFATACGAANCVAQFEGRICLTDVSLLIPQIEIRPLKS
jgi:1-phosphofructokinase family hexose kinase